MHNNCTNEEYKIANRGNTGRSEPRNVLEQIALNDSKARPTLGRKLSIKLKDSRWASSDGWVKMERVFRGNIGGESSNITIHYVLNETLKLIDDFKIVFPK